MRSRIIGIHRFSVRRLNARWTEDRRRSWSSPSDTIIESGPTTKPSTLNLWFHRNAMVGVANSSRSAAGSPTTANRTGPNPSPNTGPNRPASSSSTGVGSAKIRLSRRGCSLTGGWGNGLGDIVGSVLASDGC